MFSIASAPVSASSRNSRQNGKRTSDDLSTAKGNQRGPKRPKITDETFEPLLEKKVNGHGHHINGSLAQNGHAFPSGLQRDASVDTTSLALRRKGTKHLDRDNRGRRLDDKVILVSLNIQDVHNIILSKENIDQERELCCHSATRYSRIIARNLEYWQV